MPNVRRTHKHGFYGYQYGKEGVFHKYKDNDPKSEQRALKRAIQDGIDSEKIRRSRSNIIINWLGI